MISFNFIAQSGFIIKIDNLNIGIDLWLENPVNKKSLTDIPKLDYTFITHDHPDHGLNDLIALSKRDNSIFISTREIANKAKEKGVENVDSGLIGGSFKVKDLVVEFTQAIHSSDTGIPCGIIIKKQNFCFYHMGDTAYFSELEFLGDLHKVDVLLVPIGGRFTMGPKEAARAVSAIKPKLVIPIHYNTFPLIQVNIDDFIGYVENLSPQTKVIAMNPGDNYNIE